jgi:GSH-dependent disulfide-bond oxidoreductase
LSETRYVAGADYTIADMAIWPWYGGLVLNAYSAAEFLDMASYKNLVRWTQDVLARPAVQRGRIVNRSWGPANEQLRERHSAGDIDSALKG